MPFVSITRLRVRSWQYLPAFFLAVFRSALQARYTKGNLGVSVMREARNNTFWTRSLWIDETAMKAFMVSGAHRSIMRHLLEWCEEVHRRMLRDGRPSRVNHPSEAHRRFDISAPNARRTELRFR
jgi:heme-degrading monooxygenase HmoA